MTDYKSNIYSLNRFLEITIEKLDGITFITEYLKKEPDLDASAINAIRLIEITLMEISEQHHELIKELKDD